MFEYLFLVSAFTVTAAIILRYLASANNSKLHAKKKICEGNNNAPVEYVQKGFGFMLHLVALAFQSSRKNYKPETVYHELHREYGSPKAENPKSTFIIKCFNNTAVYAKDYDAVLSFLCNNNCSDRVSKKMADYFCGGRTTGITFNCGEEWKELRRYTIRTLGRLGFGKHQTMSHILDEQLSDILEHIEQLSKSTGNKIPVESLFTLTAINIVWCLVGGEKFNRNDAKLKVLIETIDLISNFSMVSLFMMDYLPKFVLLSLDIFGAEFRKFYAAADALSNYFENFVEEMDARVDKEHPVYLVDHFLAEIEKHKNDNYLNKIYCKEQLVTVLSDLFIAGMDTTSKFMECSLMFLVLNPEVQITIQVEIDSVMGSCLPSYAEHRKSMPFTQATLQEIHRMSNIFALAPRMASKDFHLGDHNIKKGTFMLTNMFHFRMDESYWGDPEVFRPQRFLDSENNLIVEKMNRVMPFGAGVRVCLGEQVAAASSFTFLTGILQKYNLSQSYPNEYVGLTKSFVTIKHPQPFHITWTPRLNS